MIVVVVVIETFASSSSVCCRNNFLQFRDALDLGTGSGSLSRCVSRFGQAFECVAESLPPERLDSSRSVWPAHSYGRHQQQPHDSKAIDDDVGHTNYAHKKWQMVTGEALHIYCIY